MIGGLLMLMMMLMMMSVTRSDKFGDVIGNAVVGDEASKLSIAAFDYSHTH